MERILLVTTSYPGRCDGEVIAGGFVPDFARALLERGVAVEIVAPATVDSQDKEQGVAVTRFAVPRLPLSLLNPRRPRDWTAIARTLFKGALTVSRVCEKRRPDHILALWILPSGYWAMRTGRRLKIPYSTWALGSDVWALAGIPGVRRYLAGVLRSAAHRFADGVELAGDVERIGLRPCHFLPTSRYFGPAGSRPASTGPPYRLAFLGRWHPNKGADLLMDALLSLNDEDWSRIEDVRLHGGGPLESCVQEGVARLRDSGRPVSAGGYLDLDAARGLFEWSDYVLIPSRIESIPVVFSDAMQAKRPVIATPVGDLPRLIGNGRNGLLAAEGTSTGFTSAIRRALTRAGGWHIEEADTLAFTPASAANRFLESLLP